MLGRYGGGREFYMSNASFNAPKKSYFAAANGYSGFRSYFDKVFNPTSFIRLYILKGGPGTGKSSLMKKVCTHFTASPYECEAIYCSSDPKSLDGVIINGKNGRIGILDGTAPHETDAKFPGAIDEIVNLGSAWSREALTAERARIVMLAKSKGEHYKAAYEYLMLAGAFDGKMRSLTESCFKGNDEINDMLFSNLSIKKCGRVDSSMLLSSFGKNGFYTVDAPASNFKNAYSVVGKYGTEYIVLNSISSECKLRGIDFVRFPSPYSDSLTEAVYIPENDTFISAVDKLKNSINASQLLDADAIDKNKDKLEIYEKEKNALLSLAKDEFKKASDSHFSLEAIYSPLMNFDMIDEICERLIKEIQQSL